LNFNVQFHINLGVVSGFEPKPQVSTFHHFFHRNLCPNHYFVFPTICVVVVVVVVLCCCWMFRWHWSLKYKFVFLILKNHVTDSKDFRLKSQCVCVCVCVCVCTCMSHHQSLFIHLFVSRLSIIQKAQTSMSIKKLQNSNSNLRSNYNLKKKT